MCTSDCVDETQRYYDPARGSAMNETHIYLDESGFTGQDLLNPHQSVFCIASTALSDAVADVYHAELLAHSNAREVRHNRLARRPYGREKIANFLRQIREDDEAFAVWVCHKEFALLTYFVDLWCENLAHRSGVDLYKDGAALAMANMTYYYLRSVCGDAFLNSVLHDFQVMMISRTERSYRRLWSNLWLKFNSSDPEVQEVLTPFLGAVDLLGYDHLRSLPDPAIDPALPGLVRICHLWRGRTPGPFVLYHDQATQLARDRAAWEVLLSKDMAPKEFGTGKRHVIFPVNVERIVFVDSFVEKQVQLCDVVAGAVATWSRGLIRGETSEYHSLLREVDLQPLVKAVIWPEPEVDPDKLGTRGLSGDMIDYITDELTKRGT